MGKFSGVLLVSDFDGTLIDHQLSISDDNVAAVQSFIEEGGRFVGATGRTELNVRPYARGLSLSSPWILYNGAAIYDWQSQSFVYKALLDRALAASFVARVIARIPAINVQVFTGGPFCQVNPQAMPDTQAVRERQSYLNKPVEEVDDGWLKVLFCDDDPQHIDLVEALLGDDPLREVVHSTRSAPRYFELTAAGVNKGSALVRLKQLLDPVPQQTVAIGDYLNDIEMLLEADVAAAPCSALPEVKAHARIITQDHRQSAIADLVQQLEAYVRPGPVRD